MKKILPIFVAVLLVVAAVVPMFTFAADEAAFTVTVDNATPAVGDTITVTVAFTACPANINTLEIIVPIDTEAFEVVGTAPTYDLTKNADTTGGSSFRASGSEAFINFVDVKTPLAETSTTVMTFQLKVKAAGTIAISEDDSFLVDENTGDDVLWTATAATVTIGEAPVATEEPTVAPTEEPTVAPTEEPTVAPTEEPTVAPTEEPTVAPTEEPTVAPTEEPTVAPTEEPTVAPTEEPTVVPTEEPEVTEQPRPTAEPEATAEPRPTAAPEAPKTGSTQLAVVVAALLVLAAVATTTAVLSKKED